MRATLSWDRREDVPAGALLPAWPDNAPGDFAESRLPGGTRREVSGALRALTERDLGCALERVMRAITAVATLSDAVLETHAARVVSPRTTPPDVLQALALDLWRAGFPVRFAPSWTPVPDGAAALGTGGAEEELRGFLSDHPTWEAL